MISVVIPAFNAFRTIGETISSVLAQTRPANEVIVVDDGSTDGTGGHPSLTAASVRVLQQANAGTSTALNLGIAEATGDVVAFVDADDLWTPEKIALQMEVLERNRQIDGVLGHVESFACPTSTSEERARWDLAKGPEPGWLSGCLAIRRTAAAAIGPFDTALRQGHFVDWTDRARAAGIRFEMLPQIVLRRRVHAASMSHRIEERNDALLKVARAALLRRRRGGGDRP